jgi:tRNA(fMet)-specific endonuclease VapC
MPYLLDTTTLSFVLNGNLSVERKLRATITTDDVYASVVSEGELLVGALRAGRERRDELLTTIPLLLSDLTGVLDVTRATADTYGRIRSDLFASGRVISMNDCWLAATALSGNLTVVTHDRDFHAVHDLPIEDWLEP